MNVAVRDPKTDKPAAGAARHRRLRHPSVDEDEDRHHQISVGALAQALRQLRRPPQAGLHRIDGLSAHGAGHRARRRLAAERRAARLRSRLHAQAASRPQQHRVWRAASAADRRLRRAQHGFLRRRSRTAINDWQIDAWVGPEPRLRGSIYVPQDYPEAAVKEIERRAGDPRFVQVSCAPQSEEPLGQSPLLADVRGCLRGQTAARAAHRRHSRPSADRRRLAVVLFRAPFLQRAVGAVGGDQHGARRRVRAVSRPAGAAGRRPASPGRRRCAGGWISTGSACGTRCRM